MKLLSLLKKNWIENLRDWKILILTLSFAPLFVFLMHFYFGESVQVYRVIVINQDRGVTADGAAVKTGEKLINILKEARYPEGGSIFLIEEMEEIENAKSLLKDKTADLAVVIPSDYSETIDSFIRGEERNPAVIQTFGDPSNAKYLMSAVWNDTLAYLHILDETGQRLPVELSPQMLSGSTSLNEFDLYVPGLLGLALIMLMFTAAASVIKEKDKGTIMRLRISRMTTAEWIMAVSGIQVLIGVGAVFLTYLSAFVLGYRGSGSLAAILVVTILSCLSVIGISLIVAAFLRTIFDLMTIGCFPFFILLFFSGSMFPLPQLRLFSFAGRSVNVTDILPTTHAINALGKILNYGVGLEDVLYELIAMLLLTIITYVIGIRLIRIRHM
ncbi:MAG: ABC transporter permease [Acidobacteria bacterium]|nr:ABC transporter permease [Acidobacteriota bacterium]MBU4494802.1 ABC transporter permease [Acidobacteriota bacterium]MCG2814828.1 ABC transporter permease [Candidatus Aminicenantes bacterium]